MTCDLHETTFATTTDNGDTRKKTKKDIRKYSGETVGVAFWSGPSQYLRQAFRHNASVKNTRGGTRRKIG